MRIGDNNPLDSLYDSARSGGVQKPESQTLQLTNEAESNGTDQVDLSNATSLVAFARGLAPANRQAKVSAVVAQVHSGQYRIDTPQVSRAMVHGHLRG